MESRREFLGAAMGRCQNWQQLRLTLNRTFIGVGIRIVFMPICVHMQKHDSDSDADSE